MGKSVAVRGAGFAHPEHEGKTTMSAKPIPKSWRDVLPVHPAADLFPLMSHDELLELGKDIKKNGLESPIVLWSPRGPD